MQLSQNALYFNWSGSGVQYIDIARSMSLVNRKLYRQQGLWTVVGCKFRSDAQTEFQISTAPTTWMTRNSLVMAFNFWKDQQKRAYKAASSSIKPTWQDFKVWMNEEHRSGTELVPRDGGPIGASGPVSTSGSEWVKSKLVIMETDHDNLAHNELNLIEPEMHILGDDNGTTNIGIIKNYGLSRAVQTISEGEPALLGADMSFFVRASEAIDEPVQEIVEHLEDDNDVPPYDPDSYGGGSVHFNNPVVAQYHSVTATDGGRLQPLGGFAAPNGLVKVQTAGAGNAHDLILYVGKRRSY